MNDGDAVVANICKVGSIDFEVVVEFDLLAINHRDTDAMEMLGLLAKEGWQKAHIGEYHSHKQALSKYTLSAILLSEPVLKMVRERLLPQTVSSFSRS